MKLLTLLILVSSLPAYAQSNVGFRPYVGVHASGDSQMYYLGPSFQLGSDYRFTERWAASAYLHSYRNRVNEVDGFQYEKGKFTCLTGALLLEYKAGKRPDKGLFFGGGVAVQRVEDRFDASWGAYWDDKRTYMVPAIRFGHAFPIWKTHCLTAEINATGPYHHPPELGSTRTELITQLSLGTRLIW